MSVRLEFKPQDLWIGAFWQDRCGTDGRCFKHLWVCLIPMVPLHVQWETRPLEYGQ